MRCFFVSRVEPSGFSFRAVRSLYKTSKFGLRSSTQGSTGGSIKRDVSYLSPNHKSIEVWRVEVVHVVERYGEKELHHEWTSGMACAWG